MKIKQALTLKTIRTIIVFLIVIIISGNIGYRLGAKQLNVSLSKEKKLVINTEVPQNKNIDFSEFWDVWQKLEQKYVDKTKLDPQKMVYGAISGMVASLGDPYTLFLPPKDNSSFKEELNGEFDGIGAQLGAKDDKIVVIAPLKDMPAEKAGIMAGDWIIKVNDEDTFGWNVQQAVAKIRGPKNTQVKLTIMREGKNEAMEFTIKRDTIIVKSVEFDVKQLSTCKDNCPKVGYLKLSRFGDTTNDEWNKAVSDYNLVNIDNHLKGIVLDMRNNPGGYFQSAIYIASEFLKSGVIVMQENSDGSRDNFSVNRVGNLLNTPLVVIVNKGSASAAEIVTGALKDHGRAKVVGETSFGKGSVQTPEDMNDGSGLHITTARWIMPNGEWINGKGITPDIEVKFDASSSADLQLDRAIEELIK